MLLLTLSLLAAAPVKPLPMLSAPLGRLGDVVEEPPTGGVPGSEKALIGKIPGCEKEQAIYLSRMVAGTLVAVQQAQDWLRLTPGIEKKLFAKDKLAEVAQLVAASTPTEQKPCAATPVVDGFKLELTRAAGRQCPAEAGFHLGEFWWA